MDARAARIQGDRSGLVWQAAGRWVAVLCHGEPPGATFESLVGWVRAASPAPEGILWEDRRRGLAPLHRSHGARLLAREIGLPVALISDSALVRAGAGLARWTADLRTFPATRLEAALDAIRVPEAERGLVRDALHVLRVARAMGRSQGRRSTDSLER